MTKRALLFLPLLLAGCVSFGPKPPASLLTITPDAAQPAGPAAPVKDGQAVTVLPPVVPQAINVLRVPMRSGATQLTYLKDAQWVDTPAHLFRDLLAATIAAKTGHPVLDMRQYSYAPGIRLSGRLDRFDYDVGTGKVVVVYDATLVKAGADVQNRRFEAEAASGDTPTAVAGALNHAANEVAGEVAEWIGS
jgi:cholesterol transport system auxiliary component